MYTDKVSLQALNSSPAFPFPTCAFLTAARQNIDIAGHNCQIREYLSRGFGESKKIVGIVRRRFSRRTHNRAWSPRLQVGASLPAAVAGPVPSTARSASESSGSPHLPR